MRTLRRTPFVVRSNTHSHAFENSKFTTLQSKREKTTWQSSNIHSSFFSTNVSPEILQSSENSIIPNHFSQEYDPELFKWDPHIPVERAVLPPSSWYIQPQFLSMEKETLFKRNWLHVGRLDQVKKPGDYFAGTFLSEPYIVTRDKDGALRAFYNVCRHHAARVVKEGDGAAEVFQCPYHGWTYELDGRLKIAPKVGGIKDFKPRDFGLFPINVATLGPWIFLSFNKEIDSNPNVELGDLHNRLNEMNYTKLHFVKRLEYTVNCNWKVYIDNYLDGGYHVNCLHKELGGLLDMDQYKTEVFPKYSIQSCEGGNKDTSGIDFADRVGKKVLYAWIYPNFMVNRYGPIMDTNTVIPISHNKTKVVFDYFFEETEGNRAKEFIERSMAASDLVQIQDQMICESVQAGLSSSAYKTGRYSPRLEFGEHHFHKLIYNDISTKFQKVISTNTMDR